MAETTTNTLVRSQRAAAISAAVSGVFGASLIVWGVSLHSIVMTAGGILAASRGVMAAFIIAGIRLSRRHTSTFSDGLYKIENIFATVVGVIVLVLAYEIARLSIKHLSGTYTFTNDPKYALPFFLGAALLAGFMFYYKQRVAKAEGCPSLRADSYFSLADAVALVIIGVALALDIAGYHRVDAIAGLFVACFLAVIGVYILLGGLKVLLDASVDSDLLAKVKQIAQADPGIRDVLSVDGRNSGSFIFLHLVVEPAAYDLEQAGDVSSDLERRIKAALPNVDRADIEFNAPDNMFIAAAPLNSDGNTIAAGFESAPMIGFLEVDGGTVTGKPDVVSNPAAGLPAGRGVKLAVFLGKHSVDVLLLKEAITDQDVLQTLKAYGIDVSVEPSLNNLESTGAELVKLAQSRARVPVVGDAVAKTAAGQV
ncbi:MAG TPA: cation diffusion facilitator family transporter [Candidatus Anoxymicrobiaceae bacterium]